MALCLSQPLAGSLVWWQWNSGVFILYLSKVYLVSCTSLSVVVLYASCWAWGVVLVIDRLELCLPTSVKLGVQNTTVCTWLLWTDMWFEHVFESIKTFQRPDRQFGFLLGQRQRNRSITSWLSCLESRAIADKSSSTAVIDKTGLRLRVQDQCKGAREGLNNVKASIVVLVTQYGILCFLSIICSFLDLCKPAFPTQAYPLDFGSVYFQNRCTLL